MRRAVPGRGARKSRRENGKAAGFLLSRVLLQKQCRFIALINVRLMRCGWLRTHSARLWAITAGPATCSSAPGTWQKQGRCHALTSNTVLATAMAGSTSYGLISPTRCRNLTSPTTKSQQQLILTGVTMAGRGLPFSCRCTAGACPSAR